MDESPAVHGGRADRWSAAFRSGAMQIGRIRRARHGSRPTVGSTGVGPCGADGHAPRSTRMDESPAVHGGRADRWSAALQSDAMHIGRIRRAMRGSRPTVGSTRMGPCGATGRRPRSIRMDESPAVHGGRADRWSAALLSDTTPFGRIRRTVHGSRSTVGSTWDETTGLGWMRRSRPTVGSTGGGRRWASGTTSRGTHRSPPPDRHGPGWRGCRWLGGAGRRPCVGRGRNSRVARPARCGPGAG